MGHINQDSYKKLQKRLDRFAQGAPESESLYRILEILFTKTEAELVSKLPLKVFQAKTAMKRWGKSEKETLEILNTLADKGILFDIESKGKQKFILAPTMAGFFEFSIMRTDGKFNRKVLSELFYQYLNVEEDFVSQLFGLKIPITRTLVHEDMIEEKDKTVVLDYERASKVIETASCITVGTCYCRHKMEHVGKACEMPQDVCLTFNKPAQSLAKHGVAKEISKVEARKILDKCINLGLVQMGDNIRKDVGWICNCCGCCCEALVGYRRTGYKANLESNFLAVNDSSKCSGCSLCTVKCPVGAIAMKEKDGKRYADIDLDKCIGCGVCKRFCPKGSIKLKRKKELNYTPKDAFERCVMNAIEKGTLHNYIFDNFESLTQEMLRKIFGMIFELESVKKIAVSKKMRSKFLFALTQARKINVFEKLYRKAKKRKV